MSIQHDSDDEPNRAVGYDTSDGGFAIRDPYEEDAWIKAEVPRYLSDWR